MNPLIGILSEVDGEAVTKVQDTYIGAIEKSGGVPILLPYVEQEDTIDRFVGLCDGFFFTGGADIDPARYGEVSSDVCGPIQPLRDALEFRVFEKVIATDKPILAICRGAQLVNAALGGTLYQDLPSELGSPVAHRQSEAKFEPSHAVKVLSGTPLHALVGTEQMTANSFHHQAIKRLGKGLSVMALAEDGIIEALFLEGDRYLRAYQWHPERLLDSNAQNRMIFTDFIDTCRAFCSC